MLVSLGVDELQVCLHHTTAFKKLFFFFSYFCDHNLTKNGFEVQQTRGILSSVISLSIYESSFTICYSWWAPLSKAHSRVYSAPIIWIAGFKGALGYVKQATDISVLWAPKNEHPFLICRENESSSTPHAAWWKLKSVQTNSSWAVLEGKWHAMTDVGSKL